MQGGSESMGIFDSIFGDKKTTKTNSSQQGESSFGNTPIIQDYTKSVQGMYSPQNFANAYVGPNQYQTGAAGQQAGLSAGLMPAFNASASIGANGLDPNRIAMFQSPYQSQVINATMNDLAVQNARQNAGVNANAAKLGALTGSQGIVARNLANESQNRVMNSTIAGLRNQGFNTAADLAKTSAGLQLQGAGQAGNLAATQGSLNQGTFNMGTGLQQNQQYGQLLPYQLAQQGAQTLGAGLTPYSGQQTSGTSQGTSTTTGTPSLFSIGSGIAGMALNAASMFRDGGVVPGKADGGGVGVEPYKPSPDRHDKFIKSFHAIKGLLNGGSVMEPYEPHKAGGGGIDLARIVSPGGAPFTVAAPYEDQFLSLITDLESAGYKIVGDQSGGYNPRNIRGTNTPSQHAFGRAIDVNWHDNAQGTRGAIPAELARELAAKHGMTWGGDWKRPDPMHFEIARDGSATPMVARGITSFAGMRPSPAVAPQPPDGMDAATYSGSGLRPAPVAMASAPSSAGMRPYVSSSSAPAGDDPLAAKLRELAGELADMKKNEQKPQQEDDLAALRESQSGLSRMLASLQQPVKSFADGGDVGLSGWATTVEPAPTAMQEFAGKFKSGMEAFDKSTEASKKNLASMSDGSQALAAQQQGLSQMLAGMGRTGFAGGGDVGWDRSADEMPLAPREPMGAGLRDTPAPAASAPASSWSSWLPKLQLDGVWAGKEATPMQRLGTALMSVQSPTMNAPFAGVANNIMQWNQARLAQQGIDQAAAALVGQLNGVPTLAGRSTAMAEAKLPHEIAQLQVHSVEGQRQVKEHELEKAALAELRKTESDIDMAMSMNPPVFSRETGERLKQQARDRYNLNRQRVQDVRAAPPPVSVPPAGAVREWSPSGGLSSPGAAAQSAAPAPVAPAAGSVRPDAAELPAPIKTPDTAQERAAPQTSIQPTPAGYAPPPDSPAGRAQEMRARAAAERAADVSARAEQVKRFQRQFDTESIYLDPIDFAAKYQDKGHLLRPDQRAAWDRMMDRLMRAN